MKEENLKKLQELSKKETKRDKEISQLFSKRMLQGLKNSKNGK